MDQQSREIVYRKNLIIRDPVHLLQKLMILYIAVWSVAPPLEVGNVFRLAALVCAAGWFILDMMRGLRLKRIHVFALLFIFLVIAVSIVENGGQYSKLLKQVTWFMLVMAFIMNYSYRGRWNELKLLVPLMLALLIVFNIVTSRELIIDPTLARRIVRADEEIYAYMKRGVGGYELVYSQVLMFPVILSWTINAFKNNKIFFALGVGWTLSYATLILSAGYSIAIVTTICAALILFFNRRRSIVPALTATLILIVILVLMIGYVDPVRTTLLEIFDGTKVANKVQDIYDSIHGVEVADSIMERWIKYKSSLLAIFNYPVIGGLWWASGGGHSAILDAFAKYGLFGGVMFIKMFYHVVTKLKRGARGMKGLRLANAMMISLILVSLLDTVPYNMVFPVLIVTPVFLNYIKEWGGFDESSLDGERSSRGYLSDLIYKLRKPRRMGGGDGTTPGQPTGY